MWSIYIYGILVSMISLSFIFMRGHVKVLSSNMDKLLMFSAGVLSVIAGDVLWESFEVLPWKTGLALFVLGVVVFRVFDKMSHVKKGRGRKAISKWHGLGLLFSDAVHNTADGVVIAVSAISNPALGVGAFIGVFIHEVVQEMAEFVLLLRRYKDFNKTVFINFLVSLFVFLGISIVVFVGSGYGLINYLMAFISGGLAYIAVFDAFNWERIVKGFNGKRSSKIRAVKYVGLYLSGVALMAMIMLIR